MKARKNDTKGTPTRRQLKVLCTIEQFRRRTGYAPSYRELAKALHLTSLKGIQDHLDALERKGLVTRQPNIARSVVLTEKGRAAVASCSFAKEVNP